jgi:hypothetical protein
MRKLDDGSLVPEFQDISTLFFLINRQAQVTSSMLKTILQILDDKNDKAVEEARKATSSFVDYTNSLTEFQNQVMGAIRAK